MTKKENAEPWAERILLPIIIYSSAILFPLSLLLSKAIDGASYVAFNALILFGFGVYKFHPRIVEFTVGGNSIKLKETLHEAEKLTKELRELRRVSMLQFFSSMYATTGSNSVVMKRFYDFLTVYNVSAESPVLIEEFKTEFINCLSCLKNSMGQFVRHMFDPNSDLDFDAKVVKVYELFKDESEEYFDAFLGHRIARDFAVNLMLIEEIYKDVFNNTPHPVELPGFLGVYKVTTLS